MIYQTIKCNKCLRIHKTNMYLEDNNRTSLYIDHLERELLKHNENCCDHMDLVLSDPKEE